MKIALIGATGNVGTKILAEAANRGHQITAISRHPDKIATGKGITPTGVDCEDVGALAEVLKGQDAVMVSVDWAKTKVDNVFEACRKAGVKRILTVGGASSLEVAPGVKLIDSEGFPDFLKPIVQPAIDGLARMEKITDLDWTYVSPSQNIEPGERTGKFRLAKDTLIKDDKGESRISQEDFAVALVDEIEKPAHIRQRFTVGY